MVQNVYKVDTNVGSYRTRAYSAEHARSRTILLIDGVTAVTRVTLVKQG